MPVKAVPVEAAEDAGEPAKPAPEEPVAAETKAEDAPEKPVAQPKRRASAKSQAKATAKAQAASDKAAEKAKKEQEKVDMKARVKCPVCHRTVSQHCLLYTYARLPQGCFGQEAEDEDCRGKVRGATASSGGGH